MHPLTMLVFGVYGKLLPNQNGAPHAGGGAVEIWLQVRQVNCDDSPAQR